ncbi:hypothetical protein CASFOL_017778 [Castilleja foliolosa]|uniref:Uncharacterized protein n=1 Tax=Castilleja foliolosa TaxID=1961234 RepID=A0ABD3D9P3_9LAMI
MEEIDRMDAEIEMEDVDDDAEDEPVVDIDNGDRKNPVAVTEYMIDDLYAHYKRAENRGEMVRVSMVGRLKWTNYLRPDVKRGLLSNYEEKMVIDLHAQLGNRWSKTASHLPGRTDNEIKNHGLDRVGFDTKNVYGIIMELQEKSNWIEKSSVFSFIDKKWDERVTL